MSVNIPIRHKGKTSSSWTTGNPVLLARQLGFETNTGKCKLGDGTTAWNSLPYLYYNVSEITTMLSPSNVKSIYESNANTNAFTDAYKTSLDGLSASLASKADLVGGVIPTNQIPAIAISEFLGDVNSEASMLMLSGQKGDWCIRTDQNMTYVITGNDPSLIGGWRMIETPGSPVTSVNGQTGVIVLGKSDIGLGSVPNTDATQRSNHSGTQDASTITGTKTSSFISDFNDAARSAVIMLMQNPNDFSFTSSTLANVTGWSQALEANKTYMGRISLAVTGSAGGMRIGFSFPAGTTIRIGITGASTAVTSQTMTWVDITSGTDIANYTFASNSIAGFVELYIHIDTSSTAGNLQAMARSWINGQSNMIHQKLSRIELWAA